MTECGILCSLEAGNEDVGGGMGIEDFGGDGFARVTAALRVEEAYKNSCSFIFLRIFNTGKTRTGMEAMEA